MNARDLPEKWERKAKKLRQEVERVKQGSGWWAHYARQADKLEQCARELRAALPEHESESRELLSEGQFLMCHEARHQLKLGAIDVAACGSCEICYFVNRIRNHLGGE